MKMDQVANSKNDEFYTPEYAVRPIAKHLRLRGYKSVWCPFDNERSNFVGTLRREGFDVSFSHIESGGDFFKTNISADVIVSNPPYSIKSKVIERAFSLKRPFAFLVGVVGLFESESRFCMFKENKFEIMYMNRRVSYFKSFDDQRPSINPPFSSVYISSGVLSERIVFERIRKT